MKTAAPPSPRAGDRTHPAVAESPAIRTAATTDTCAGPAAEDRRRTRDAAERRTRDAVVNELLAGGPLTAVDLARRLELTTAGVRRHLDQLEADGAVRSRAAHHAGPRGRGRPARAYVLTEAGRARLPHRYDDLAVQALDFLAEQGGQQAVEHFARRRAEALVEPVRAELAAAGADVSERVRIVARALTGQGYAASSQQIGVGQQLCQHHCPVAHVAARFPQFCEQESAVLAAALGTYAQRLATIARGDSFCTTFVPLSGRTGPAPGDAGPAAGPPVPPPATGSPPATGPAPTDPAPTDLQPARTDRSTAVPGRIAP
ncbi:helix-turn-helix transcriptional regulator [Nakamurella endophytica]|uniref:Transcriptional regulator n=1 Tax=Nakamurella endophytica TaxID=1748367 RepID=A0A917WCC7_9ACTN|nr:metalloregulator ArsR/SmtB family transcription factor [Nakamurella endophytica]GGL93932.1 transcriptional regulator [Nakamurella endophytica]